MSSEDTVVKKTSEEEVKGRVETFVKEYGELVQKHKIDFATYPVYVPDGKGGFQTIIQNTPVDITNQPVKSNFIPDAK